MSNRFLNDHSAKKVEIFKILGITAGRFHAWCDSNVGRIRKPTNSLVKLPCWFEFWGLPKPEVEFVETGSFKLKWYQRLWVWIKNLFIVIFKKDWY